MDRFAKLDGACVCLTSKLGVYREADVHQRGSAIFAKYGSGYIRLYAGGGTSVGVMRWIDLHVDGGYVADDIGRLSARHE